jgi:hypothetical protein
VSDETVINDEVRQKIDSEAENIIHACLESVQLLKSRGTQCSNLVLLQLLNTVQTQAFAQKLTDQQRIHFENLFVVIDRYMKGSDSAA